MIGVLTTHHCHNGLLPSLVAPSQDAEMAWQNTSSFPLCPDHRAGPYANEKALPAIADTNSDRCSSNGWPSLASADPRSKTPYFASKYARLKEIS